LFTLMVSRLGYLLISYISPSANRKPGKGDVVLLHPLPVCVITVPFLSLRQRFGVIGEVGVEEKKFSTYPTVKAPCTLPPEMEKIFLHSPTPLSYSPETLGFINPGLWAVL